MPDWDLQDPNLPSLELEAGCGADVLELASLLSVAVRVEPELIRHMRLKLAPHLDVGCEGALWFSPLVLYRSASAIVFHPHWKEPLRRRLVADSRWPKACDLVEAVHAGISPALLLEEKILRHSLALLEYSLSGNESLFTPIISQGTVKLVKDRIDGCFHEVLRAWRGGDEAEGREGIARWATQALPELPPEAQASAGAWALSLAVSQHQGRQPWLGSSPDPRFFERDYDSYASDWKRAVIWVRRFDDQLELGWEAWEDGWAITVPNLPSVPLKVTWSFLHEYGSTPRIDTLVLRHGDTARLRVSDSSEVVLTAPDGSRYPVPPPKAAVAEIPTSGNVPTRGLPLTGAFSAFEEEKWSSLNCELGARWSPKTTTFAVYSKNAERVVLEIYSLPLGEPARFSHPMEKNLHDNVWRAELNEVPQGSFYGFRCWGPNWPFSPAWSPGNSSAGFLVDVDEHGNRFNPNKLLTDPYAREHSHDRETPDLREIFRHHSGMYGSGPELYAGVDKAHPPVIRREFDTGHLAPKSMVVSDRSSTGRKPRIARKDSLIYETHLRGFTRHPSASRLKSIVGGIPGFEGVEDVPAELRGTYAGAACMAKYLKSLGYTAVEFLPVQEFDNDIDLDGKPGWDRNLDEPPHNSYWGYATRGFFAPDIRYSHDRSPGGPTREFKRMVKAFHDHGLEVYLDIAVASTGEGGLWDNGGDTAEITGLRGLDNAEYYALMENGRHYWDSTGLGINLSAAQEAVQKLILDSLAYWSREMGVDGFRFDLAAVLGRTQSDFHFDKASHLLRDIAEFSAREGVAIIAEPWDLGGYFVGDFPREWDEWNNEFTDAVRRFLKGENNAVAFAAAMNGDYARFHDQGGPHKSIHFLTSHIGFTLMDLVSYNARNNTEPWPFGPSDGGSEDNLSWDSNGDRGLRRQRMRNFLVVQFFSRGIPMTAGGDEFARTLNGNNNPYNIDSVANWQNYDMIATAAPHAVPTGGSGAYHDNYGHDGNPTGKNGLFLFLRFLAHLRKANSSIRQDRFADFSLDSGEDVTYWFKGIRPDLDLHESSRSLQLRIDGSAVGEEDFLLCMNMSWDPTAFQLPPARAGRVWSRIIDTAGWAEPEGNCWSGEAAQAVTASESYTVQPWSIFVCQERPTGDTGKSPDAARKVLGVRRK